MIVVAFIIANIILVASKANRALNELNVRQAHAAWKDMKKLRCRLEELSENIRIREEKE